MSVKIIVDSTTDIVPEIARQVITVPLTIRFADTEYTDGVDIVKEKFYELLVESDALPSTSQPAPNVFMQAYDDAIADGSDAVVITVSSKLSGTYQSAAIAAMDFSDKVKVVDSKSVAIGAGILVEMAVKMANEGKSADEIVSVLEKEREKICVVALLDTLEYLKKGGRISAAVAFAGGVLSIKPVVSLKDGAVEVLGKARGSRQGNNLLMTEIEKAGGVDYSKPVMLGYTGLSDVLLKKYIEDSRVLWENKVEPLNYALIGSTVGTHVGPGAVAAAFFKNNG